MNELQTITKDTPTVPEVTENLIIEYLDATGMTNTLPVKDKKMFIQIAQAFGLNPFKREIYCIPYGGKVSILTGYEVYLKRAARLGKLDGWKCEAFGTVEDGSLYAKVTIYRKDWSKPFEHTAYYVEAVNKNSYGKPISVWAKMPIFMTKKVAIAQAFRLCFPDEFGGMPYTTDEIDKGGIEDVTPSAPIQEAPPTNTTQQNKIAPEDKAEYNRLKKELNNYADFFTGDNKKALEAIFASYDIVRMQSALNWAKEQEAIINAQVDAEAQEAEANEIY